MPLITCVDCKKEMSDLAPACPHCGKPLTTPEIKRSVGILLGIGIALIPFVFVWFTLRKGHTVISRFAGFSWLFLTLLISLIQTPTPPTEKQEEIPQALTNEIAPIAEDKTESDETITTKNEGHSISEDLNVLPKLNSNFTLPPCEKIRFKLTTKQIAEVEKSWGAALFHYQQQIQAAFEANKPDNYQGFAQYKVRGWLHEYNYSNGKISCGWDKFGWGMDNDYREIMFINIAMTDLNIASIQMQSYLKNGDIESLNIIKNKMKDVSEISKKYSH